LSDKNEWRIVKEHEIQASILLMKWGGFLNDMKETADGALSILIKSILGPEFTRWVLWSVQVEKGW
jgi:hypothetical protein